VVSFFLESFYSLVVMQKRGKPSRNLPLLLVSILVARFVLAVPLVAERMSTRPHQVAGPGRLPRPLR